MLSVTHFIEDLVFDLVEWVPGGFARVPGGQAVNSLVQRMQRLGGELDDLGCWFWKLAGGKYLFTTALHI